jgi:Programmed cell death protein 2, C-terminal putative domain
MDLRWPDNDPPAPGVCSLCSRERVLEMQVMSPIWHFMEECADWQDPGSRSPALQKGLAALRKPLWDWLTIAVYVCPNACVPAGSSPWCCIEEAVAACHGSRVARPDLNVRMQLRTHSAASSELSGG